MPSEATYLPPLPALLATPSINLTGCPHTSCMHLDGPPKLMYLSRFLVNYTLLCALWSFFLPAFEAHIPAKASAPPVGSRIPEQLE